MHDGLFSLGRPSVSDRGDIRLIANAYASDQAAPCSVNHSAAGVERTPAALAAWLDAIPGLDVSTPTNVTVGGLADDLAAAERKPLRGLMVDLTLVPGWTPTCDAGVYTFSFSRLG